MKLSTSGRENDAGDYCTGITTVRVSWQFVPAPNYTGDIRIGFLQGAQVWWGAIAISQLPNGIHGVEYFSNGTCQQARMNGDMGQSYIISGLTTAVHGHQYMTLVCPDAHE